VTVLALIHHFAIHWDPGLRGVLVLGTGIAVLMGSVYALLATNLGARLGFLVTVAGLAGWMTLMGFVWSMYGIGYKGTAAHWKIEEVYSSSSAKDTSGTKLAKAHDLSKWEELPDGSQARADAAASATAALTTQGSTVQLYSSDQDYKVVDAFTVGGKKKNFYNAWFPAPHPPHYSVVQVQAIKKVTVAFGEAAPKAELDPSAPIVSVIMVRDLGKLRVPSFLIGCASLIVFGVSCSALHRRDKAAMAARAAATV
jgi:hypothetical protein